jgi:hypothetical protein
MHLMQPSWSRDIRNVQPQNCHQSQVALELIATWVQARPGLTRQTRAARASCRARACAPGSCAAALRARRRAAVWPDAPRAPPAYVREEPVVRQGDAHACNRRPVRPHPLEQPWRLASAASAAGTGDQPHGGAGHRDLGRARGRAPACRSMKPCGSGPPQPRRLPMRCQARNAGPEKKPARSPLDRPKRAHTRCHTASCPARRRAPGRARGSPAGSGCSGPRPWKAPCQTSTLPWQAAHQTLESAPKTWQAEQRRSQRANEEPGGACGGATAPCPACEGGAALGGGARAREGHGQVDAVQRHPVDLRLPALPAPPCHAVAARRRRTSLHTRAGAAACAPMQGARARSLERLACDTAVQDIWASSTRPHAISYRARWGCGIRQAAPRQPGRRALVPLARCRSAARRAGQHGGTARPRRGTKARVLMIGCLMRARRV